MSGVTAKLSIEIAHETMQELRIKAGRSNISLPGLIDKMIKQFLNDESPTTQDFAPLLNKVLSEVEKHYRQVNIRLDRHSESLGKLWDDVAMLKSTKESEIQQKTVKTKPVKTLSASDFIGETMTAPQWGELMGCKAQAIANSASSARVSGYSEFTYKGHRFVIVSKGKFRLIGTSGQLSLLNQIN